MKQLGLNEQRLLCLIKIYNRIMGYQMQEPSSFYFQNVGGSVLFSQVINRGWQHKQREFFPSIFFSKEIDLVGSFIVFRSRKFYRILLFSSMLYFNSNYHWIGIRPLLFSSFDIESLIYLEKISKTVHVIGLCQISSLCFRSS